MWKTIFNTGYYVVSYIAKSVGSILSRSINNAIRKLLIMGIKYTITIFVPYGNVFINNLIK